MSSYEIQTLQSNCHVHVGYVSDNCICMTVSDTYRAYGNHVEFYELKNLRVRAVFALKKSSRSHV